MKLIGDIKKRIKGRFANSFSVSNIFHYLHDDENFILEDYLGISLDEYADYIISTFTDYANEEKGFAIDHIKPISRALTVEEYKSFWHYTNTKAVSKKYNADKRNEFNYEYNILNGRNNGGSEIWKTSTSKFIQFVKDYVIIPRRFEGHMQLKLNPDDVIEKARESYTRKVDDIYEKDPSETIFLISGKKWYRIKVTHPFADDPYTKYRPSQFKYFMELIDDPQKFVSHRNELIQNDTITESKLLELKEIWEKVKKEKEIPLNQFNVPFKPYKKI